jgi:hypothetical protein
MPDLGAKVATTEAEEENPLAAEIAALKAENAEFKNVAQRSLEEAAGARGQVQLILDQIQRAAASGEITQKDATQAVASLREQFDTDPVKAMNDLVTMRVGPIVQEYFGRSAETERADAHRAEPALFKKYGNEVDEFMKDMPLDVKAKSGSYLAALKYVRSQHLEEEVEDARKAERERASQPEGASSAEPDKERKKALSREEREVMKLGFKDMSEDDWGKWNTPAGDRPPRAKKGRAA